MTDQEIQQIPILNVLPQRPPFIFVDQMLHYDEQSMICRATVRADNPLVNDGAWEVSGLVENIAQTCAARIGYYNKYILKRDICIGVIGAVRNLEVYRRPLVGETLVTRIGIVSSAFGISLVSADITDEAGDKIATGEMKISLSETPAEEV